jgi:TolB protein
MSSEHLNPTSIGQLTQLTDTAWNDQASWSPDGTEMVYTQEPSYNGPTSRIVVVRADGSKRRALTAYANRDSVPCFSPDGTKIAFRRDQSGTTEIWEMNADGSHQVRITEGISPTWSPDGKWIAFSNTQNIWAIRPDGSGLHAITKLTSNGAFEPSWSPDGTTISFSGTTGSGGDIWLVDADGKNARQLTFDGFDLESNWSPDGTLVVFDDWVGGFPGGVAHLGVIKRDGSGEADLTPHLPYSGIEPAWQPR